ncbi:SRPBCC domain-containing protein [Coleofasciculus sp. FACHB-1120]|uniref:SRPBCC domain-containing protein n=1 Tax=Coleofasciculus sp. FACHB-1120 TaxID=2692783 RepID=UPI0018EFE554|nr:SRPBCC domain-containing protein [Coleofasciculus sp. FACHB-1120]
MGNRNDSIDAQSEGLRPTSGQREIVITRVFNAPRELVFKAWTDPEHVAQWWGPKGFTTKVTELDLRPGGKSRYVMIGPDGTEYPGKGVFREIVPLERIVTTDEFDEGFEKVVNADLPKGMVMTVLFEDMDGKTKLTLRIVHESAEDRRKHEEMGVIGGWNSSFDCLDEFLAKA